MNNINGNKHRRTKMSLFIKLSKELKVAKISFISGLLLLLVASALGQVSPILMKQMIDHYLTPIAKGKLVNTELFFQLIFLYSLLILITSLLRYFSFKALVATSNKVVTHLRNKAFDLMQKLPISYFDHVPAGKIATRIVNDTETLRNQFYNNLLSQIIISLFQIIFIYLVMIYLDIKSGLLLLLVVPVFYGIQVLYKNMTDKPMKEFYDGRSAVNTQVNETMNGAQIIQLFQQEDTVLAEFNHNINTMRKADEAIIFADSVASWTLTEFVKYSFISILLAIVGHQFLKGNTDVSVGKLFIYINYLTRLFDLLGNLVRQLPNLQRSAATGKRVMALLEEPIESDHVNTIPISNGHVCFDTVDFSYNEGDLVLSGISFEAKKGETIGLVGHTGSGKSSIMNLLYRFYDPKSGKISIDGYDIQDFSRESVRSHMGIVLQDPYLFTGTIASNVRMGNENYSDQEVIDALEKVGAGPMLKRYENGIYHQVQEKGASFSSGERQLIAFARTLISNPKILILDEATSHIDTETEELIQNAMEVLQKGRTTFIIAHRLSTIQNANQILVLDKGQIVERGSHQDLIAKAGIYAEMVSLQENI